MSPETQRFYQARGIAVGVLIIAAWFLISVIPTIIATEAPPWVRALETAVAIGFALWGALRVSRIGVWVTRDGIRVVNPLKTRFVAWSEIAEFSSTPRGLFPQVTAELEDGSTLRIRGLPLGGRESAQSSTGRALDALNRYLQEARPQITQRPATGELGDRS